MAHEWPLGEAVGHGRSRQVILTQCRAVPPAATRTGIQSLAGNLALCPEHRSISSTLGWILSNRGHLHRGGHGFTSSARSAPDPMGANSGAMAQALRTHRSRRTATTDNRVQRRQSILLAWVGCQNEPGTAASLRPAGEPDQGVNRSRQSLSAGNPGLNQDVCVARDP